MRLRVSSIPNLRVETLARLGPSGAVGRHGVAVNSDAGVLCWAFTSSSSRARATLFEYTIECARLDGSARVTVTKGRLSALSTQIGLAIDRRDEKLLRIFYWLSESSNAREAPIDKPLHLIAISLESNHSISVLGETGNLVLKRFE